MKTIFGILLTATTLMSCSILKKETIKGDVSTNWVGQTVTVQSQCPEEGVCTAERKDASKLTVHTVPSIYTIIEDSEDTLVILYEYSRKTTAEEQIRDNFYREEIQFEIPKKDFKKTYKDEQLSEVKLVYGKHCYCKGEAGMYLINKGTLEVKNNGNKTEVKLQFTAPVSSSKIENIRFVVEG
ncbi:hypothetical protein AB4865_01900 [Capnocytophaga sp. ARDL2]|uniref:hypothetical protein n=1 Tax=Capnocytophaga sp. ARDL2 TaxID=3238809 RepID=UPI00355835F0